MISPGAIAREGYLNSVLSIAVSGYLAAASVAPPGTLPPEPTLVTEAPSDRQYSICAVSGFRALPGTLVYDEYTRQKVLPEFADIGDLNHRKFMSTDTKKGPLRPEKEDTFIDTPVDPDDF